MSGDHNDEYERIHDAVSEWLGQKYREETEHATVGETEVREQTAGTLGLTGGDDSNWRARFDEIVAGLTTSIGPDGRERIIERGRPREDR